MPLEDAKPVKKEEVDEDDDDEMPIAHVRKNSKKPSATPTGAKSKVKKEEYNESDYPLKKPTKPSSNLAKPKKEEAHFHADKKPVAKDDKKKMKKKKKKKEEEKGKVYGKKRERKVYNLPGQKSDPPEERDPLRIFYETLYEQKPGSELAEVWMMESGLLPLEKAKRVFEKKMSNKNRKLTSPVKPVKTVKEMTKSVTVKKKTEASNPNSSNKKKMTETTTVSKQSTKLSKKRKAESSEDDPSSDEDSGDEFVLSTKKVTKKLKSN